MLGLWAGGWLQTPRSTVEKLKGLLVARRRAGAGRPRAPVAAHLPDRQADLDAVLHALQRRAGRPDPRRVLRGRSSGRAGGAGRSRSSSSARTRSPIYVMSWTIEHFVTSALVRHLGRGAVRGARAAVRAGAAWRRHPRWCSGRSCCGCIGGRSSCGSDPPWQRRGRRERRRSQTEQRSQRRRNGEDGRATVPTSRAARDRA